MSLLRKTYAPLPPHTNEDELAEAVLAELDPTFDHQWQVWGTHCSGRRMRVDAAMWPRDPSAWKDDQPVFGIEFKALELMPFDTKNYTAHAAQAVDYTHVDWDDYGHLIVFTCPPPAKYFQTAGATGIDAAFVMSRLLWQLGIGELANLEGEGWTLLGQGNHVLWSERRGVHEARRWSLKRKFGSR